MIGLGFGNFQSGGGGFVGLLNTYPNAAAAYSVRRLSSTYKGSLIQVRRSSDNTLQDIGFDANGDLDTTSLLSFVGAGNGFVRTWYDQSGNSANAINTTSSSQPQIVSSGVVIVAGGLPNINFDGAGDYLSADLGSLNTNTSVYLANFKNFTTGQTYGTYFQLTPSIPDAFGIDKRYWAFGGTLSIRNGGATTSGDALTIFSNHALFSAIFDGTTVVDVYENNLAVKNRNVSGASSTRYLTIGNWAGVPSISRAARMDISEMIIYTDDDDSRVSGIKENQNNYYSIY
jgi:hypothetical protein